ncbi:MAG TPA: hypothetical protein VGM05_07285 [Planctomycetaceae bacterium]|jgi:hypothetical protein
MNPGFRFQLLPLIIIAIAGCGGSDDLGPLSGGTTGKIHNGRDPLFGIQVTVHQFDGESMEPIGVAATQLDGSFELVTMDGTEACQLPAGEYRCTLASVGAPFSIPRELAEPDTTPLKIVLSGDEETIDLDLPQLKNEG